MELFPKQALVLLNTSWILVHVFRSVGASATSSSQSESAPLSTSSSAGTSLSDATSSVEIFGIVPVVLEQKQLHQQVSRLNETMMTDPSHMVRGTPHWNPQGKKTTYLKPWVFCFNDSAGVNSHHQWLTIGFGMNKTETFISNSPQQFWK